MEDNSLSNTDKQVNNTNQQVTTDKISDTPLPNHSQNITLDSSTAVVTPIKLKADNSSNNDCPNSNDSRVKKTSQNCKKQNPLTTSIKPMILPAPISESIFNSTKLPMMSNISSSIVSATNVPSSVSTATFNQQPQQAGPQVIATIQPQQFGYPNIQNNRYSMMPMSLANNYSTTPPQSTITFNNNAGLGHTVQLMPVLNHNNTQMNPPRMQSLPLFMTPIIGSPGGMLFPPNMAIMPPVSSALQSSFLSQSNFTNVSSSLSSLASHNPSSISATPIGIQQQQQPMITTPFPLSDQFQQQQQQQQQQHFQTQTQQINIINSATQIPQAHTVLPTANFINTIPTKDVHLHNNSNNTVNANNNSLNKINSCNNSSNNDVISINNIEHNKVIKYDNNEQNTSVIRQNSMINMKHREHIRTQIYRMKQDEKSVTVSHEILTVNCEKTNENSVVKENEESQFKPGNCNDESTSNKNVTSQATKDFTIGSTEDSASLSSSCHPDITSTSINTTCVSTVLADDTPGDKTSINNEHNNVEDKVDVKATTRTEENSINVTTTITTKPLITTPPSATIPPTKRARLPSPEILNASPVLWKEDRQQEQQQLNSVNNQNSYPPKTSVKPLSNTDSLFDKMKNETSNNVIQMALNKTTITNDINSSSIQQNPTSQLPIQSSKKDGSQLKRKTAIVRPEQRKILVHYLDDLIIFESDEPFPTTNKTQVVKSALKSGTIRLDDTSSCGSGSRKSTLNPNTSSSLSSSSKLFLSDSYIYTNASTNSSLEDNEDDVGGEKMTANDSEKTTQNSPLSSDSKQYNKHHHHRHQKRRNSHHHHRHHHHKFKKSISPSSSPSSSSIIKSPNQIAPLTVDIPVNSNNQSGNNMNGNGDDSVDSSQFRPLSRCSEMSPLVMSPRKQSVQLSPKKQPATPQQTTPPPPPIKLVSPVPQQQPQSSQQQLPLPALPSNQPTPSCNYDNIPIQEWSVQDVSDFVRQTPGCDAYHTLFSNNEIDGEALLLLSKDNLIQGALNMKIGPALKLYSRLDKRKKSDEAAGLM